MPTLHPKTRPVSISGPKRTARAITEPGSRSCSLSLSSPIPFSLTPAPLRLSKMAFLMACTCSHISLPLLAFVCVLNAVVAVVVVCFTLFLGSLTGSRSGQCKHIYVKAHKHTKNHKLTNHKDKMLKKKENKCRMYLRACVCLCVCLILSTDDQR